jgi:Holliday junction resolvasome RuvABC endonuclease subunit
MTRVLALDISTKAGYAVVFNAAGPGETPAPSLEKHGRLELEAPVLSFGSKVYPWNYLRACSQMALRLFALIRDETPDVIVIEETNLGKSRYAQKILEWIHCALLISLENNSYPIVYLSSSSWRQALGLTLTKEDKKNNAKLSKAKRQAATTGGKLDKKALGIRGKVNKKHVALRYVNETYGLKLKVKDNDSADAICLATAYFKNAERCDGL